MSASSNMTVVTVLPVRPDNPSLFLLFIPAFNQRVFSFHLNKCQFGGIITQLDYYQLSFLKKQLMVVLQEERK